MFTVKKVLNSSKAAPEFVYLSPTLGASYKAGTLLTHRNGQLVNCSATEKPTHLAVKTVEKASIHTLIPAVALTPDVILETVPTSYPSLFHVGEKYDLLIDGDYAVSIKSTKNNGVATIVSNYDSLVVGDPLWVKFE